MEHHLNEARMAEDREQDAINPTAKS
jgi:hypothetical protein